MKYTKKNFELFKKECEKWKGIFGLHNWRIYYKWDEDEENLASTLIELEGYVATIYFPKSIKELGGKDIQRTALHEMLHMLLGRLNTNATARFVSKDDIKESEEEVVRRLEHVLYGN